jgi:hypothetical protein
MKKFFEKLEKLDRRIIFIFVACALILPLFIPLNIKFSVTRPVQSFYDAIESLPPGSKVLLSVDYDPGSMPELWPMHLTAVRQLCKRNIKIISIQLWATGSPLAERAFNEIAVKEFHKKYGEDFVNLGFKEGREVVMVSMGNSIPQTFPTDYHGNKTEDLPIMKGVYKTCIRLYCCERSGILPLSTIRAISGPFRRDERCS